MTPALIVIAALMLLWAEYWYRRYCKAADILADAGARLSLHCKNPIDDEVCRRIVEHFEEAKRFPRRKPSCSDDKKHRSGKTNDK